MASTYPPPLNPPPPPTCITASPDPNKLDVAVETRLLSRTPSPTPSEAEMLSYTGFYGPLNFKKYLRKRYIPHIIFAGVFITIVILFIAFHSHIVAWFKPVGDRFKALPAGWLIPVGILIILSFPPLFGHEIVAIIVGLIWGIGIGFGIVALGTLLGEIANFFVFRYLLRKRAERYEQENLRYGLLAHVVRTGGFPVALMMRLSLIPPHFTTIVFTVSGMPFITFLVAAILSLPRQLTTVVIGDLTSETGKTTTRGKVVAGVVVAVTALITIFSMRFVNRKIAAEKPNFIRSRQKARQTQTLARAVDVETGFRVPSSLGSLIAAPQALYSASASVSFSPVLPTQSYEHLQRNDAAPSLLPDGSKTTSSKHAG